MKYIELTPETDKLIAALCDLALKAGGLQAHGLVTQVMAAVREKPDCASPVCVQPEVC